MKPVSIYLSTEAEKYRFITIARAAGAIITGVSSCGSGFYIQCDATNAQTQEINKQLEAFQCT